MAVLTLHKLIDFKRHFFIKCRRSFRSIHHMIISIDPVIYPTKKLSINGKQSFFGYYDKTPFSLDGSKILGLAAPIENNPPKQTDELLVGYFDSNNFLYHPVGRTNTWCWQMGCRLHWFPKDANNLVIYNILINGEYGSIIQNIYTKEIIRRYSYPFYDIDNQGLWAISLNFSRLHRLRPGYGYVNLPDKTEANACPDNDGVWSMNLITGSVKLVVSLERLSKIQPHTSMNGAEHYINHLSFNPSGSRFMFFHLWVKNGKRFSRLFTSDIEGEDLYLLANEGMVSHYTWKDDTDLLVYSFHKDTGRQYHLYRDKTSVRTVVGEKKLTEDGHPSFNPANASLLTDTYPDKYSDRKILIFDSLKNLHEVGAFFSPFRFKEEVRCDLHPRWDRIGRTICFDSAHDGYRSMYLMKIDTII